MDAMSTLQLSQLREQAAQMLRKYRIPLLVFLLGVALGAALVALTFRLNARYRERRRRPMRSRTRQRQQTRPSICPRHRSSWRRFYPRSTEPDASG